MGVPEHFNEPAVIFVQQAAVYNLRSGLSQGCRLVQAFPAGEDIHFPRGQCLAGTDKMGHLIHIIDIQ